MQWPSALLTALLLLTEVVVESQKVSSAEFLRSTCSRYMPDYEPLVKSQLDGLLSQIRVADITTRYPLNHEENGRFNEDIHGWPALYIIDGELYGEK